MKRASYGLVLAGTMMLSGCFTTGPGTGPAPQTGVEGTWKGTDGVAVSTFQGGTFVSTATDTGNRLAEGKYTYRDQKNIEIEITSLIRQTTFNANCTLVTSNQLNCTSSSGSQFVLTRQVPAAA